MPYDLHDDLPRIFGVILKLHYGVTKIKLGNKVLRIDVLENAPNGVYYNETVLGHGLVRHEVSGSVFTRTCNVYSAINSDTLKLLNERFVKRNHGVFIPNDYLVRFVVNGRYIYQPMSRLFGDAEVAAGFTNDLEVAEWVEKSNEILKELGGLTK
ncbi:hypothetical protein D3C78_705540 [compost metagenome]